ncbi:MAG: flagellar biosynthesis protein FliQ [Clostridiales bacterium]|nr:flagellar biosynthesis protein FliQ [Clostridiales bacterium]
MSQTEIISILQEAVYTTIISVAPVLIAAIVVGLIVSIFQATTQIHEQTLAYVPKIVAVLLTFLISASFIINTISGFTYRLFESVNTYIS